MLTETDTVTAAIVVIGDEVLSGRTRDTNSGHIAETLTRLGVDLREIRVVPDEQAAIVEAVNALRARATYVFTTGGIGPTHDDITADAIAAAFGVGIDHDPRAVAMLRERFSDPADLNEGRLRMARIPFGAELIANPISKAPGFRLENVIVMAGVPAIMRAMLDQVAPTLKTGEPILSETVRADAKEGDIATPLAAVQRAHPEVSIGSYPFIEGNRFNTNLVIRSRDPAALAAAKAAVAEMLSGLPRS
ncbi:competence/damage-inducible protein A [Hansschlegelia beijingensis]|uniref:Molybdenum cofactor synthesis domain-containing protein n=1 Tax=Hansschlegelia beijingensis TaxID=1133344 RepID=A0A7W6CWL3_9HYPH|nr:molybdopterin-binding protein [Hansschlegelia beijingensis]MBB3972458.1 molybdenum cofactor synthesis domain-containing protein [Hansschlegelia beijingensis]